MKFAFALFALSLALIGSSVRMAPFRLTANGSLPMIEVPNGNSEAFFHARDQSVTKKFILQDYGITLLACALVTAVFKWQPFKAPASRLGFVFLALGAPPVSAAGYVFDLVQGQERWEFPPWADSLGIPLMGVPVMLLAGWIWAFGHFYLLAGVKRQSRAPLSLLAMRRGIPWLIVVSAVTAILIVITVASGAYWYSIPGALWLYFYFAIATVRYEQNTA